MYEKTVPDPTDKWTLRSNAPPLPASKDAFKPINLPGFGWDIRLPEHASPEDPITLFTIYFTPEIIDLIVEKANTHVQIPKKPPFASSKSSDWCPTCPGEIYKYLAIRIYMTICVGTTFLFDDNLDGNSRAL